MEASTDQLPVGRKYFCGCAPDFATGRKPTLRPCDSAPIQDGAEVAEFAARAEWPAMSDRLVVISRAAPPLFLMTEN